MKFILQDIEWDLFRKGNGRIRSWYWLIMSKSGFFYLNKKGEKVQENREWYKNTRKEMEEILFFTSEEEARNFIRNYFEKHPKQFAEYIAQRMGVAI